MGEPTSLAHTTCSAHRARDRHSDFGQAERESCSLGAVLTGDRMGGRRGRTGTCRRSGGKVFWSRRGHAEPEGRRANPAQSVDTRGESGRVRSFSYLSVNGNTAPDQFLPPSPPSPGPCGSIAGINVGFYSQKSHFWRPLRSKVQETCILGKHRASRPGVPRTRPQLAPDAFGSWRTLRQTRSGRSLDGRWYPCLRASLKNARNGLRWGPRRDGRWKTEAAVPAWRGENNFILRRPWSEAAPVLCFH